MAIDQILRRAKAPTASATKMVNQILAPMQLTLGEIREIVETNPTHPASAGLRRFYEEHAGILPDTTPVYIDRVIIQGILENRPIRDEIKEGPGRATVTKKLEK